jgi:hypothetical protein
MAKETLVLFPPYISKTLVVSINNSELMNIFSVTYLVVNVLRLNGLKMENPYTGHVATKRIVVYFTCSILTVGNRKVFLFTCISGMLKYLKKKVCCVLLL